MYFKRNIQVLGYSKLLHIPVGLFNTLVGFFNILVGFFKLVECVKCSLPLGRELDYPTRDYPEPAQEHNRNDAEENRRFQ